MTEDELFARKSLAELNAERPLGDVMFELDDWTLGEDARGVLQRNADWLRRWASTRITIEGHCDERGTREYNLALGERRAVAVKAYLASLGIPPDRIRTVSYGNEFPFDPGKTEDAFSKNRRGHFVITSN